MDSVQSAAYQKGRAKIRAFEQWERSYRHNRMQEEFRTRWLGVVEAPPRFCYQHAIMEPPSIHHHPLWKEATSLTKKVVGQRRRPKYTRCTTSTALQLAVDHAFTGSYARRFRPLDPPCYAFTFTELHHKQYYYRTASFLYLYPTPPLSSCSLI